MQCHLQMSICVCGCEGGVLTCWLKEKGGDFIVVYGDGAGKTKIRGESLDKHHESIDTVFSPYLNWLNSSKSLYKFLKVETYS